MIRELPNSCLLANGSPTGCESCSPSLDASYCDLCGHWREGVRKLDEDVWACAKCLPEEDLTGEVRLPYMVYYPSDGQNLTSRVEARMITIVVDPGAGARGRALPALLAHLNEWNRLSLGSRTFFTDEKAS